MSNPIADVGHGNLDERAPLEDRINWHRLHNVPHARRVKVKRALIEWFIRRVSEPVEGKDKT